MGTQATVLRLFPQPSEERPLCGLYLEQRLHALGSPERPFVYANFVASLDGRIAVTDTHTGESTVPRGITSANDLRLLLELQCQADCLVTHGAYLRALAEQRLGNVLQVGAMGGHDDLVAWRKAHRLDAQPAVVIASSSLDFTVPEYLRQSVQQLYIATGSGADPARIAAWRSRGYEVLMVGGGELVEGGRLVAALGELGYRSVYLLAGPIMLRQMLQDRRLSRLYLTLTHQIVGGEDFHTIYHGAGLGSVGELELRSLYLDRSSADRPGQWFAQFDPKHRAGVGG